MGFFNLSAPEAPASTDQPVVLHFNEESVSVPASDIAGKTVAQLFNSYASDLGDVDKAQRYVHSGQVINGDTTVTPGMELRAAYTSESKG